MSADAPESATSQSGSDAAAVPPAKKAAAKRTRTVSKPAASRVRIRMVGTGPDYIDGTVKVLPVEQAQRLIRLGHAR